MVAAMRGMALMAIVLGASLAGCSDGLASDRALDEPTIPPLMQPHPIPGGHVLVSAGYHPGNTSIVAHIDLAGPPVAGSTYHLLLRKDLREPTTGMYGSPIPQVVSYTIAVEGNRPDGPLTVGLLDSDCMDCPPCGEQPCLQQVAANLTTVGAHTLEVQWKPQNASHANLLYSRVVARIVSSDCAQDELPLETSYEHWCPQRAMAGLPLDGDAATGGAWVGGPIVESYRWAHDGDQGALDVHLTRPWQPGDQLEAVVLVQIAEGVAFEHRFVVRRHCCQVDMADVIGTTNQGKLDTRGSYVDGADMHIQFGRNIPDLPVLAVHAMGRLGDLCQGSDFGALPIGFIPTPCQRYGTSIPDATAD